MDINQFEYSMGTTALLEFDGSVLADSALIVGAFSSYTCRGITRLQYLPDLDKYIGFITVYANNAAGDSITFKVFEPNTGKERDAEQKISFVADTHLGNLEAPFTLAAQPLGD